VIHIRVDQGELNSERRFACGIGPELPEGDKWFYQSESAALRHVDCPGCNPGRPAPIGIPISDLDGRNGGNDAWRRLSESWGYP
jgi:hypothetical protein